MIPTRCRFPEYETYTADPVRGVYWVEFIMDLFAGLHVGSHYPLDAVGVDHTLNHDDQLVLCQPQLKIVAETHYQVIRLFLVSEEGFWYAVLGFEPLSCGVCHGLEV